MRDKKGRRWLPFFIGYCNPFLSSFTMQRLFKKYPNRRLYDTTKGAYVRLDAVETSILAFEVVRVVQADSEEDITEQVLLQILAKRQQDAKTGKAAGQLMTQQMLANLIRLYSHPSSAAMFGMLEYFLNATLTNMQANTPPNSGMPYPTQAPESQHNTVPTTPNAMAPWLAPFAMWGGLPPNGANPSPDTANNAANNAAK